jgi:uncharacterized protein (DUF433 family)
MEPEDRIIIDPDILAGKPILRGTRIPVELLLEILANGWTYEEIFENYPQICTADLLAALQYAADLEGGKRISHIAEGNGVTFLADENILTR